MNLKNNIEFELLLQNEEFIRLMKDCPLKADELIENLCLENPVNKEYIRLAARLIARYKTEMIDFDENKIRSMWNNVIEKSATKRRRRTVRLASVWQIAASIIVLLSFTYYFVHHSQNTSLRKCAAKKVRVSDEAKIIISDGSVYKLKSNESRIRYDASGKEIVIEEKNDEIEKLSNHQSETGTTYNQIIVPYGRRHSLTLSDGTVVQLNSGSKLTFPAIFSGSKREVFLKGEGYFEVAKDASKPFIVNTDFINVRVLGTHFNISAYENEKSAVTVLVEGSVEVYNNNDFLTKGLCKIKPGQGCFFSENSSGLKVREVDVSEFVSWKDGFLQIKDQPLEDITKKIEKYYNKAILISDNELAGRIISGKLVLAKKMDETLDFLARTTKSTYTMKNDGTYIFFQKTALKNYIRNLNSY